MEITITANSPGSDSSPWLKYEDAREEDSYKGNAFNCQSITNGTIAFQGVHPEVLQTNLKCKSNKHEETGN